MGKTNDKKEHEFDQFISLFISMFCFHFFCQFEVLPTSLQGDLDCSIYGGCSSSNVSSHRGVGVPANHYRDARSEDRETDDQNDDGVLHQQRSPSLPVKRKSQDGNKESFGFRGCTHFAQRKSNNVSLNRKTKMTSTTGWCPAVLVKTRVLVGCSVSRAHKT